MKPMALFLFLGVMAAAIAHAETKIGVVDMEKILLTLPQAKKVKDDIDSEYKKKKAEFEKTEASLQNDEKELEKKKAVLSEDALKQKQEEFQKKVMEFRESVVKSQTDIEKHHRELIVPVL